MKSTTVHSILLAWCAGMGSFAYGQDEPPVKPNIQSTPVPAPVQLPPPTHVGIDASRPIGVVEAVQVALAHQTAIQIAKHEAEAARARSREAEAGLLPTVNTNANYTQVTPSSAPGGGSGFSSGFTISQLIFDFNVTRDTVRQAQALERSQGFFLTQAQADVILATKQAFYSLEQDTQLVAVAEANKKDQDGQFALANARFKAGLGAPQDVILAQTNLDSAVVQLTNARSAALIARVGLAQTLGVDPLTPIVVADSTEPEILDVLPDLIKQGLARRPEVLQAFENLKAASLGTSIARKSSVPSVSMVLGRTGNLSSDNGNSAGIFVSWSFYDGGLASARVKEARASTLSSEQQLQQVKQNVAADIASVFVSLKNAEQLMTITQSQIANARESVRLAEGRYTAGLATFLEVIDAQTALTQASINQVNALASLQSNRAAMEHAIGASPLKSFRG